MKFVKILPICLASIVAFVSGEAVADVVRFSPLDDRTVATEADLSLHNRKLPSGGVLRQAAVGSFDTLNTMVFPSSVPATLRFTQDSLLVSDSVEIATFYGLLAKRFDVSDDFSEVRVELDPEARWHDGTAVTARDVEFTFSAALENAGPDLRRALGDVSIEIIDDTTLRFSIRTKGDWQWVTLVGGLAVQSKAHWDRLDPTERTLVPPLGSGPYKVSDIEPGRRFNLVRAQDYWAKDHPVNAHRWNFDEIKTEYFFDITPVTELVRRGGVDVWRETEPTRWRAAFDGPALRSGEIVQTTFRDRSSVAVPTLIFNLRRPVTADLKVRQALAMVLDPTWFYDFNGGVFPTTKSIYGSLRIAAEGKPTPQELALLSPFAEVLPEGFLSQEAPAVTPIEMPQRERRRRALELLNEAGYELVDGKQRNPDTGDELRLDLVTANPQYVKLLGPYVKWLSQIGVTLNVKLLDPAAAMESLFKSKDFDMTTLDWGGSALPGRAENFLWHSKFAKTGIGYAGLESDVADTLIDTMNQSLDDEKIVASAQAFDRYLRWNALMIPFWQNSENWYVHGSQYELPPGFNPSAHPGIYWRKRD
ncbi:MAG: extracellular solute-binding protein [Pseudomonadota bacterium]